MLGIVYGSKSIKTISPLSNCYVPHITSSNPSKQPRKDFLKNTYALEGRNQKNSGKMEPYVCVLLLVNMSH